MPSGTLAAVFGHLPEAVSGLAAVAGVLYLWAVRRRSPRATGLAAAGLAGLLGCQLLCRTAVPALYEATEANGGLFGLTFLEALSVINTAHVGLFWACLLLVVAAVGADRRRPGP